MPRRSQENYFDDFWLDLVKNDARDHGGRAGDTGDRSTDKKRSQYFVNDIMVKYVRSLVFQKCCI